MMGTIVAVHLINAPLIWDVCCMCGTDVALSPFGPNYGIPMYESEPVAIDYTGPWAGFSACRACYDAYMLTQTFPVDTAPVVNDKQLFLF